MRRRPVSLLLVASLLAAACGGASEDTSLTVAPDQEPAEQDVAADTPEPVANEADDDASADVSSTEETPAEVVAPTAETDAAPAGPIEPQLVQFATPDGETLEGALFGDGDVGIVLAHMRGRDKTTWYAFAESAVRSGYRVLAFDFRGYGGSTGERDTDLDVDLIAAVGFLRGQGISKTVVMGASMGATATVNVASRLDLSAAVSLSAPDNFLGLEATDVAAGIGEPLLLIAAENDQPYADAAREIDSLAQTTQLQIFEGNAHGTNLFAEYDAQLTQLLLDFVAAVA